MAVPATWETQHAAPTIHSACSRSNDLYIIPGSRFSGQRFSAIFSRLRGGFPAKTFRSNCGESAMGSDNKGEQLSKASLPLQVCMSVRASVMPFAQDSARGRVEQAHLPPCAVQMPLPLSQF